MKKINKDMHPEQSFFGVFDEFLKFVTLAKKAESYAKDSDWIKTAKASRIEPICVTAKSLIHKPYYGDVLQINLNIISTLYMSAVPMVNVIGKVKVAKILGQLNPDRDLDTFIGMENDAEYASLESDFSFGLPSRNKQERLIEAGSLETKNLIPLVPAKLLPSMEDSTSDVKTDVKVSAAKEAKSHSVGKELDITLQADGETMNVKVSVQLSAVPVDDELIGAVMTNETLDDRFTERYHKWNAGAISFGEFLLAGDILNKRQKMLMKDDVGFYEEALRRSRNGKIWGVLLKAPSLAEASNIYIIDQHIQKTIERKFRGKLKDDKVRKQVFSNTKALVICVVDTDFEIMKLYYRNIVPVSTIRIKDIQKKDKGGDMLEMINTYNKGVAPVF